MTRSPRVRAGDVENDGFGGVAFFSSGLIQAAAATVRTPFVAPFSGFVVSFDLRIAVVLNNAGSLINMGTWADAQNDDLLNDFDAEDLAAGYYPLIGNALWVSKAVSRGQAYGLGGTFSNTNGSCIITCGISQVQAPYSYNAS